MTAKQHIDSLLKRTQLIIDTANARFNNLGESELNWKADSESWSILECLEHLNRYSEFYHKEIENALTKYADTSAREEVKYSWFGKKSIDLVHPDNVKQQKTLKRMNPQGSRLSKDSLEAFLQHQKHSLDLIKRIGQIDLNRKAIRVEFFKLMKLRVGEAIEFLVTHEERHLAQAVRVMMVHRSAIAV